LPILDDFNRADESPIAGLWSQVESNVQLRVVSNRLQGVADNAMGGFGYEEVSNGEVGLTWISLATRYCQIGSRVRLDSAPGSWPLTGVWSGYVLDITFDTNNWNIIRRDSGVNTTIAGPIVSTNTPGDSLKFVTKGPLLQGWRKSVAGGDWIRIIEATDATYTIGRSTFFNRTAAQTFDDWFINVFDTARFPRFERKRRV
jgi:hypothetical protein